MLYERLLEEARTVVAAHDWTSGSDWSPSVDEFETELKPPRELAG
ncbi:hypothetical protein JOF56_003698 [Kibdelosporangium banguiense]|uniref:Uncharacterized protein n=1 Tax=Kibdelosporangium banguiense TaxID=1365924 RepID=A0ABS4TFW3_9PSEU|nr:hypothetical protein [Kibdelosporangium banguiense]